MSTDSKEPFRRLEDLLQSIDDELHIAIPSSIDQEIAYPTQIPLAESYDRFPVFEGFVLFVNKTETHAILKYIPSSPPSSRTLSLKTIEIVDRIKNLGFTYGILEKNIQKALQLIHDNPQKDVDTVAALGRNPTPGSPPQVEYWIGNEDYVKLAGTIQSRKNDLLMSIADEKPGIPGLSIRGKEIPPPPIPVHPILPGDHVRKNEKGEYYAECSGTVCLTNNILSIYEVNRNAEVTIQIADDKMQVLLCIEPPVGKGQPATREQILSLLSQAGVKAGIQSQTIDPALYHANEKRQPVRNAILAQGQLPSTGRDASITWHIPPTLQKDRFVINEDGSVDFYNQANILTVSEGDHLLSYSPATPGHPGVNVLGESISSQPGKSIPLEAGPNIRVQNEGTEWYAACTGLYRLHNAILEVQPLFYVKGDVDFSIGNIDFLGDVVIAGNVLDGFEVRAKGAISVMGTVESAILEAGKCIEVKNGIFGKGKGKVTAGINVVSFFLQNAEVCALQDVIVGNQILNSRVFARRHVEIRHGKSSLIGGITVAGSDVRAKSIGSEYGVRTVIEVGYDFLIMERMLYVNEKEKSLRNKLTLLENSLDQELRCRGLSDEEIHKLRRDAQKRQDALQAAITHMRTEYKSLTNQLYLTNKPQIFATDTIYPDVVARFHDTRYKFRVPVPSAVVGFDPQTEKITIASRGKEFHS